MSPTYTRQAGRNREALAIQVADKTSAVGRLMLGKFDSWEDYLKPATTDYSNLPRKQLKAGYADIRNGLKDTIDAFYSRNFEEISDNVILKLYDDIVSDRGLEVPLNEFENKYGKIKRTVLQGNPAHLTVSVTLWGLQFKFPEDLLSKDIISALRLMTESRDRIKKYKSEQHRSLKTKTDEFLPHIRHVEFAQRAIVLSCFNLMEAYLNGLAWDYCQSTDLSLLSNNKRKLLTDRSTTSIRDKLTKYPAIIAGLDDVDIDGASDFLDVIKPFRDSLVHPSPFSAPEKFGGYEKLKKLYELDRNVSIMAVKSTTLIIKGIFQLLEHSYESPQWLIEIEEWLTEHSAENS